MLFKFDLLKSKNSWKKIENFKISVLFDIENNLLDTLKKSLNKIGIVVLTTSPFTWETQKFWIIEFKISKLPDLENLQIHWILPEDKIENWLEIIKNLELTKYITYINNTLTPIDEWKIIKLLEQLSTSTTEKKTKDKKQKDDEEKKLKQIRQFIEDLLKEWRNLQEKAKGFVLPMHISQLKNILDELEKLKKSRNIEKLTTLIEKTLNLMEEIELKIVEKQKEEEIKQTIQKSLSELEILPELEKFKRIQKAKWIKQNIKLWLKDQLYKYLWKPWLLFVLTSKELLKKTKFLDDYINYFNKYIELFFILLIVELNINLVFHILINPSNWIDKIKNIGWILYFIIIFGIFGFVFFIWKFLNRKLPFIYWLISIIAILLIWYLVKNIILSTFALPL